jgi:hypothetical protein
MNIKGMRASIDAYAHKIAELSKEQDDLYIELVEKIGSTDEFLLDAVFECCYNGGVQADNYLKKQLTRLDRDE